MTFIVLLVVGLVLLAGIIAFAGDRLGTYVGRRRLSLFGARPRRTGQMVGVLAGILIMLSTLGVLALAFQNATATLLNFQRTVEELNRLRVQDRVLNSQISQANSQLADLRSSLAEAEATIANAEAARDEALEVRDETLRDRDVLLAEQAQLEQLVVQAANEVQEAELRLEDLTRELGTSREELDTARTELETATRDRDTAREEVDKLERDAVEALERLEVASRELEDLQQELEAARTELDLARDELATAQRELDLARSDLADAVELRDQAVAAQHEAETIRDEALAELETAQSDRDTARDAQAAAQEQRDNLEQRVMVLGQEAEDLERTAVELREQAAELEAENERLAGTNERLEELNQNLQADILLSNRLVQELRVGLDDLQIEVEQQATQLRELQFAASRFEGGDVYFVRDQLIYSGAIYSQEPTAVRQELARFVQEANAFVARRGVEGIRVTAEQFNLLVEVISQTPESDLVRLISPSNQISSTIEVIVEAIENTQLYQRGQLVSALPIHLGSADLPSTQNEIRNSIAQLRQEAIRQMRRSGLDEGQSPDFGPVTDEMFTNMLLRLTGPVTIALVATEPILRAGPARLELMILY